MNAFEQSRVGRTSLALPRMGLGTAHLGELYRTLNESDVRQALSTAWDLGIRYFDTAPFYGRGLSEHRVGGFLRTMPRREFIVSTKVGRVMERPKDLAAFDSAPWKGGLKFDFRYDYTYAGVMRSYEQSLLRLGLDTIDALIIHDLDPGYHGAALDDRVRELTSGGIKALEELKRAGDIGAIGMGINNDASFDVAEAVDLDFCLVAMPYTLVDHKSLHQGMRRCVERGVSVVVGSPFASGILVTGSTANEPQYAYGRAPVAIQERVKRLEAVCAQFNMPLAAAALQFVLAHPAVVSVIPGAVAASELEQNRQFIEQPIDPALWDELRAQSLIDKDAPTPP